MMSRTVTSVVLATLVASLCLAGCQKGPMQKAGEKVDEVTGQDKLIGKGPAEKTGRKIDNTVDDVKK
jgi:outer membrane murein-binding lipoprotein Lpp